MQIPQIKYLGLLGSLIITGLVITTSPIVAQQPSASESSALLEDKEITRNIRNRIRQAIEKNTEDTDGIQIRGFVGEFEAVTAQSITLSIKGETRIISVNPDTVINDEKNNALKIEELEIGRIAIVTSKIDKNGMITANEIKLVPEKVLETTKKTAFGSVKQISAPRRPQVLTLLTEKDETELVVQLNQNSKLYDDISKDNPLTLQDLNPQDKVIAIYASGTKDTLVLRKLIRVSAAPEATPSASPTP